MSLILQALSGLRSRTQAREAKINDAGGNGLDARPPNGADYSDLYADVVSTIVWISQTQEAQAARCAARHLANEEPMRKDRTNVPLHPKHIAGYKKVSEAKGWDTVADLNVLASFILHNNLGTQLIAYATQFDNAEAH